jgi:hypothetical protein
MKATSTVAGTMFTTAIYSENPDNAIDEPLINFQNAALTANVLETDTIALVGGDANPNPSTFTSIIDAGSQTLIVQGSVELGGSCEIRGTAVPASS